MLTMQQGATALESGVFDTLFLVVLALGGFVIATAIVGFARRDFNKTDIAVGVVNGLMVLGLALFCAIPWAFNNPTAPFAKEINGLNRTLALNLDYESPADFLVYSVGRSSNWTKIETRVWRSETLGLIVKHEVVATCFAGALVQANKVARDPSYDGEIPRHNFRMGYAYYTLEGEYLSAGDYTGAYTSDYSGDIDAPGFVAYRFLARDKQGGAEAIELLSDLLRDDWQLFIAEYEAAKPRPALYTREEIDALVQESWDDQS